MKLDNSIVSERNYSLNVTSGGEFEATVNFTQANFALVLDEDPGWKAAESLFGDFVNTFVLYPSQHQVFDLLKAYEDLCSDQLALLRSVMKRGVPGQTRFARTVEAMKFFQEEKWTWRLLRVLFQDRFDRQSENKQDTLEENEEYRELMLVRSWCEMNAAEVLNGDGKVQFFAEKLFVGENTLHNIKGGRHGEMDVDAALRNPRQQDELDKMDEERLIQLIFAFVRSGDIAKAVDLCVHSGQPWRAAALMAAEVYRDKNYDCQDDFVADPSGNQSRDIWKATVWRVVENKLLSAHERATMGILAGHLPSVLPVCASWQDYLWAYTSCVAECQRDLDLRKSSEEPLAKLPSTSSTPFSRLDLKWPEIFGELEASANQQVVLSAKDPFRVVQKLLILNDATMAVSWLQRWLIENPKAPRHLLRFVAHVILALRLFGLEFNENEGNDAIVIYVQSLIQERRIPLIATYSATLPHDLQVYWYSRFLAGISETTEREECLDLADRAGLDLKAICIQVVENIIAQPESMDESFRLPTGSDINDSQWMTFGTTTTDEDKEKLKAIEWLLFDPSLRYEAMFQANSLARMFLANCKHSACKELFNCLPSDCYSWIIQEWRAKYGAAELPVEMKDILHEYLCIRAYLEAHDHFLMWLKLYEGSKPTPPTVSNEFQSSFADSIAAEHHQSVYEEELHNWQTSTKMCAETSIRYLKHVLTFPDGRWMKDSEENKDGQERGEELSAVRRQCVPLVCAMLLRIYSAMEMTRDSCDLCSIIASEDRQLYLDFTPTELKNFLAAILKCSSAALDRKCDAFGYELA